MKDIYTFLHSSYHGNDDKACEVSFKRKECWFSKSIDGMNKHAFCGSVVK